MKIKELEKTVNLAWSPKITESSRTIGPILLAAGTAAQLDASFDTSAALELYSLNLGDSSFDLDLLCSYPSERRFHSLVWEAYDGEKSVIVGGCDDGRLVVYDALRLQRKENGLVDCKKNHTGAVRALDFNPFQKHLLASGASESQLMVWDLNNLNQPFPLIDSAQSQAAADDIISVAWNKQVQHILASAFSSKCVVWDLKKNKPIMKLTDSERRIHWKSVAWNPQVATQLCLASEEDQYPVIQLWDLRFSTGPIRTLQGHQKGILSVAWCDADPELLVSCGKDNKLIVWNLRNDCPNGDVLCEMPLSSEWNFEVKWCPRNPFLVSISSAVDRRASVYSLCGGQPVAQTSNKIADSFPGMNSYPQSLPLEQLHPQHQPIVELRRPPKWMKKPVGVSFAFGGKLVSFNGNEKTVYVSQVVTEPELMYKFKELLDALEQNNIFDHCYKKAELANDSQAKEVWNMIATHFYGDAFRNQACLLLGTTELSLKEKLRALDIKDSAIKNDDSAINDHYPDISRIGPADGNDIFDSLANHQENLSSGLPQNLQNGFENLKKPLKIIPSDNVEGAICDALLLDNKELAVNLCINQGRMADALVLASTGGPELIEKIQRKYFEKTDNYITTLISAVVTEDWWNIVETCDLLNWKQVLVALINHTKDEKFRDLCELLGQRLLLESDSSLKKNALICFVCAGNINQLLENWSLINSNIGVDVQELVDVGLVMKEAMKSRGININISGCLAKALVQYAELLASQGYLTAAYTYLSETSEEENVKLLRDRLAYVLGLPTSNQNRRESSSIKPTSNFLPSAPSVQHLSYQPPFGSSPLSSFPYTNNVSKLPNKPPINEVPPLSSVTNKSQSFGARKPLNSQAVPPSTPVDNGNQMFPNFSMNQQPASTYPPPASSFQPHASLQQGPMPPSSMPSTVPSSHIYDPAGNAQFSQYNKPQTLAPIPPRSVTPVRSTPTPPAPPPSSQVPYNSMRQTPDHLAGQSRSKYVVDPSVLGGSINRGGFPGSFQSFPPIPNPSSVNPVQPFTSHDTAAYQVMPNQNSAYPSAPPSANPYMPDPKALAPPLQPNISNQMQANVAPNPQTSMPSQIMPPQSVSSMQILQPGSQFTSQRPKMAQIPPSAGWNDPPPLVFEKPVSNSIPSQPPPVSFPPANSLQSNVVQTGSLRTPDEELKKSKPALPEQHIHLQTVFEELRNQCASKTANQQMKRKLEDVARKLEMLYDNIRENKLTAQTLASLHKIANAVQQGNYQAALALYTELVSGPDFATIASFMPGIKVLMQSALQLDVYI